MIDEENKSTTKQTVEDAEHVSSDSAAEDAAKKVRMQSALDKRLGEVVGLLSRSDSHGYLFLNDLKWAVMPPLMLGQNRIVQDKEGRAIGYVSWALVNGEVEDRMASGQMKLRPIEWKCGEKVVIIDLLVPAGNEALRTRILTELKEKEFSGGVMKVLRWDDEQQRVVFGEV